MSRVAPVVVPDWYREMTGGGESPASAMRARFGKRLTSLAHRNRLVFGLLLGLVMRRRPVALIKGHAQSTLALIVAALPPARRNAIVLEFILRPEPRPAPSRLIFRAYLSLVERPAVRRTMVQGQVMTASEGERYAQLYGMRPELFKLVPWPFMRGEAASPRGEAGPRSVLSSGRTSCDWPTLLAAAEQADWDLTVVCSRPDLKLVTGLASRVGAEVRCEIPREEHEELLLRSRVYVLPLLETGSSSGHVRLMGAVEAGTPVVASDVSVLAGYVEPGQTAVLVEPGDPSALRRAVDELLDDPARSRQLAERARERAGAWTWEDYFAAIAVLIREAAA